MVKGGSTKGRRGEDADQKGPGEAAISWRAPHYVFRPPPCGRNRLGEISNLKLRCGVPPAVPHTAALAGDARDMPEVVLGPFPCEAEEEEEIGRIKKIRKPDKRARC